MRPRLDIIREYVSLVQNISRDPKGTRKINAFHAGMGEERFEHAITYDPGIDMCHLEIWYVGKNEQESKILFSNRFKTEMEATLTAKNLKLRMAQMILNQSENRDGI
jgi:hypothetical protein